MLWKKVNHISDGQNIAVLAWMMEEDYSMADQEAITETHSARLETGLVLLGSVLLVTTAIVRPADHHFYISGALLLMTGTYGSIARKLPDEWIFGILTTVLALVTTGYSIYAFVTRCPGIRNFFLVFFIEVALTVCIAYMGIRQLKQLLVFLYNFNRRNYADAIADRGFPDNKDYELYDINVMGTEKELQTEETPCRTNDSKSNCETERL